MSEKTRILVTGLPPYLTEKRLREIFSRRKEIITDCKLIVNSAYTCSFFISYFSSLFWLIIPEQKFLVDLLLLVFINKKMLRMQLLSIITPISILSKYELNGLCRY